MSNTDDPVTAYLEHARSLIDQLLLTQLGEIERAGDLVAGAIAADALVHVFGSGHSHILAEELFYRAGGLAAVNPILLDDLMLHRAAVASTEREREPGRGTSIFSSSSSLRVTCCFSPQTPAAIWLPRNLRRQRAPLGCP